MGSHFQAQSLTHAAGVVAYTAALAACVWRWLSDRKSGRPDRVFRALVLTQLVLLLDIVFNLRWKLHEFLMDEAMTHDVYGARRLPQLLALMLLAGAAVVGCVWVVFRLRRRAGAFIAVLATLLSAALRCAEVLSYHDLDAVLYHSIGKMMVVSFLWLGLGCFTCLGAWLAGRDSN